MALENHQIELLGEAAKILSLNLADVHDLSDLNVPAEMTWDDLDIIVASRALEDELQRNIDAGEATLNQFAEEFADFHEAAADVEVNPPSDNTIKEFKEKLQGLSEDVAANQNFETAAAFAGSLATLIESSMA